MQYSEAIDYLYSRLPVFHRIGPKALKPGLTNILALCEALGNPHQKFRSIHVAGTNGKGSSSHMLAAIYQSAGYRVGLYTSPHLKSFTERIRLNGQPIAEAKVAQFVVDNQALIERIEPSFFEVAVAMAFDYFAKQAVDLAIIEVGLGGRLDSTNIITPVASLITNIGFDHTDILGDTLPQIAAEKAGIIKAQVPVIISEMQPETQPVFLNVAGEVNAPIRFADQHYRIQDKGIVARRRQITILGKEESAIDFSLDLPGAYQLRNIAGVMETVDVLQSVFPVSVAAQKAALANVTSLTGLKGRFQTIQEQPLVIADTAHNRPGLQALFETVETLPINQLRIVLGFVADKDRVGLFDVLPPQATFYFCQAHTPRSLSAVQLQAEAAEFNILGSVYTNVNEALQAAISQSVTNDVIVITGSNYIVAELIDL
ncbi:bifunctional folylpolyglutamate synthase/dihydrofolate synthase [Spirosoma fluminis]